MTSAVYVNFMDDKVLLSGVETTNVPQNNQLVFLPGEERWRRVMHVDWKVVQRPQAPTGYYITIPWIYLTDQKGVPE